MPGTQPSPGTTQESGRQKARRGVGDLLSKKWWTGTGVLVGVAALVVGVAGLVIAVWQINQQSPQSSPVETVRFTDLTKVTLYNEGAVLFYPSDWDLQGGLEAHPIESGEGPKYVNPNDRAVSIEVVGSLKNGGPAGPALEHFARDVTTNELKDLAMSGLSGPGAEPSIRIIDSSESGATEEDGNVTYPVDAWRVEYQFTDYLSKRSMTVITKTAIADGRAVELIMEAPTSEFPRYREAFLELGGKLLLLAKCFLCFTQ